VGLDGSNPLAFLATLGVLRGLILGQRDDGLQLHFAPGTGTAVLRGPLSLDRTTLPGLLAGVLRDLAKPDSIAGFGDVIGVPQAVYAAFVTAGLTHAAVSPNTPESAGALFAASYACSVVVDSKKLVVTPTRLSFTNGQGGKNLLKDFRTLAACVTADQIATSLFDPWSYSDEDQPTFRWDPADLRPYAHMATDPGTTSTRSVMGANALAFLGLSFFPVVPTSAGLATTGVTGSRNDEALTWPLWSHPCTADLVASILHTDLPPADQATMGVFVHYRARRMVVNKGVYFAPSTAV